MQGRVPIVPGMSQGISLLCIECIVEAAASLRAFVHASQGGWLLQPSLLFKSVQLQKHLWGQSGARACTHTKGIVESEWLPGLQALQEEDRGVGRIWLGGPLGQCPRGGAGSESLHEGEPRAPRPGDSTLLLLPSASSVHMLRSCTVLWFSLWAQREWKRASKV